MTFTQAKLAKTVSALEVRINLSRVEADCNPPSLIAALLTPLPRIPPSSPQERTAEAEAARSALRNVNASSEGHGQLVERLQQALRDAEEFAEDAEARCEMLYASQEALQRRLDEALSAKSALGSRCVALECEMSRLDAELTEARRAAREALSAAPTPRLGAGAGAGGSAAAALAAASAAVGAAMARGGTSSRASSASGGGERATFSHESPRAARLESDSSSGRVPEGGDGLGEDDEFGQLRASVSAVRLHLGALGARGGAGHVAASVVGRDGRHPFDDASWDVRSSHHTL